MLARQCVGELAKNHAFDASLTAGDVFEDALPRSVFEGHGLQIDVARRGALQEEQQVVGTAAQVTDATSAQAWHASYRYRTYPVVVQRIRRARWVGHQALVPWCCAKGDWTSMLKQFEP